MSGATVNGSRRSRAKHVTMRGCVRNSRQTGRLTHREYNVIDLLRITGYRDMDSIAVLMGWNRDTAKRVTYDMRRAGLLDGVASCVTITREGWAAWEEADRMLLAGTD